MQNLASFLASLNFEPPAIENAARYPNSETNFLCSHDQTNGLSQNEIQCNHLSTPYNRAVCPTCGNTKSVLLGTNINWLHFEVSDWSSWQDQVWPNIKIEVKFNVRTRPYMTKNHLFRSATFRQRLTGWRFTIEDHSVSRTKKSQVIDVCICVIIYKPIIWLHGSVICILTTRILPCINSSSAVQACCDSPSLSSAPSSRLPRRLLRASLWSFWSPASAICQTSSTVSSTSSTRHLWDPCFFCSRTKSLEFTARLSEGSSCRLRTI